jgi:hypothetical protein
VQDSEGNAELLMQFLAEITLYISNSELQILGSLFQHMWSSGYDVLASLRELFFF